MALVAAMVKALEAMLMESVVVGILKVEEVDFKKLNIFQATF